MGRVCQLLTLLCVLVSLPAFAGGSYYAAGPHYYTQAEAWAVVAPNFDPSSKCNDGTNSNYNCTKQQSSTDISAGCANPPAYVSCERLDQWESYTHCVDSNPADCLQNQQTGNASITQVDCGSAYSPSGPDGGNIICAPAPCAFAPGSQDIVVSAPGDSIGAESCMQGCTVQYQAGMTVTLHSGTSGSHGEWVVEDDGSGHGKSCSSTADTHQQVSQGQNGKDDCVQITSSSGGATTGCTTFATDGNVGDSPDVQHNGQDLGPSATDWNAMLQNGGCVTMTSGGAFCISSSPNTSPPRPDDGTPGQPATPAAQEQLTGSACPTGGTCSADYYPPGTVAGSTTTTGGSSSGGTHSGGSSGGSGGSGSGSSSGGQTVCTGTGCCPAGDTSSLLTGTNYYMCTPPGSGSSGGSSGSGSGGPCDASVAKCGGGGSDPYSGPGGTSKTFQQTMSDFESQVSASPIAKALDGFGSSVPTGGTKPSSTISAFGQTYNLTPPDAVVNAIQPVLQVVMQAFWLLLAVLYFFRT